METPTARGRRPLRPRRRGGGRIPILGASLLGAVVGDLVGGGLAREGCCRLVVRRAVVVSCRFVEVENRVVVDRVRCRERVVGGDRGLGGRRGRCSRTFWRFVDEDVRSDG